LDKILGAVVCPAYENAILFFLVLKNGKLFDEKV